MKKFLLLAALVLCGLPLGYGQTTKTLTLSSDGTVVAPSNFWTTNAPAIQAVVGVNTSETYPVFVIPFPPGQDWTDFEFKASINNFTANPFYWYHSPAPSISVTAEAGGVLPDVYFTDSGATAGTQGLDNRGWRKQNDTDSIFAMLADANSICGGVVLVLKDVTGWFYNNRSNIVFSYSLISPVSSETDASSRVIWHPITPTKWVDATYTPGQPPPP